MTEPTANPFVNLYEQSPSLATQPEEVYRSTAQAELALDHLFLYLRNKGFQLTLRDYQDALKALQLGYGLTSRANLLWLCQTLWARSDDEVRLLNLLFRDFPEPTAEEIANLTGQPLPDTTLENDLAKKRTPTSHAQEAQSTLQSETLPIPGMQFVGPTQSGLGLPRAQIEPDPGETFILAERPIIPLRNLIIIWRRFRQLLRIGPKVELDIEATITERCHQGLLEAPVLIPARCNLAKLTLLIDVSEQMLPWQNFNKLLMESLQYSQLGQVTVYYTNEVGADTLYQQENFSKPLALKQALNRPSSSLLILSEGGATLSSLNRTMMWQVKDFLKRVGQVWSPVAWINPMPSSRWQGTTAAKIAQFPNVSMFELSEDGLINAIDVLRGK